MLMVNCIEKHQINQEGCSSILMFMFDEQYLKMNIIALRNTAPEMP